MAGFLGSPAMNFFHIRMSTDSRAVAVGLRPEDLRSAGSETPALLPRLKAWLEVVEPVGNEIFLNLKFAGSEFVLRTPPDNCLR